MGSCKVRKPRDALQTVRWDSPSPETCFNAKSAKALQTMLWVRLSLSDSSKDPPERENLERQEWQLSVVDMWLVIYTSSVFMNKMHSEAHGHQTKYSTGRSLRTDSSRGHPPAAVPLTATPSEPLSPASHPATPEQTFPSGREVPYSDLKGLPYRIGTRKRKLRSKHIHEEN